MRLNRRRLRILRILACMIHLLIKHGHCQVRVRGASSGNVVAVTRECRVADVFGLQLTACAPTDRGLQEEDSEPIDYDRVSTFSGYGLRNRENHDTTTDETRMRRCFDNP